MDTLSWLLLTYIQFEVWQDPLQGYSVAAISGQEVTDTSLTLYLLVTFNQILYFNIF